jgi:glycosyltransferase involved in cell wall biosynthesis
MKISIITATYKNSAHIAGCLDSVVNQTFQIIEHIIIDGASTDNTLEIIKSTFPKGINQPGNATHFRTSWELFFPGKNFTKLLS